jgi:serine phosphatase RsbU (regulator of sigma subunit)
MIPGSTYESSKIQMEEGGCIFLYTDGVKEAADISGNFFGEDRLLEALSGKGPGDPKNLVEAVAKKISLHVRDAQQFDDITMLCLKYKGKGASNLS